MYVIEAIKWLSKINTEELHNIERPIAYNTYQHAEANRDSKKRRRPFELSEFFFYEDKELLNLPEPKYGSAAMALIARGLFPVWALFAYKDLKSRADDALPPELLCYQCDDAILLAPSIDDRVVKGMLIAMNAASGAVREMRSPCGRVIMVRMPEIKDKVVAEEDAELALFR